MAITKKEVLRDIELMDRKLKEIAGWLNRATSGNFSHSRPVIVSTLEALADVRLPRIKKAVEYLDERKNGEIRWIEE